MSKLNLAIHGAAGRMGQRLVALASTDPELHVAAALEGSRHPCLGRDAGEVAGVGSLGVAIAATLDTKPDAAIDFSVPDASVEMAALCAERGIPLVVATTGLSADQQSRVREAARTIPLLAAPNMSLAVNLVMKLSQIAATALKDHPAGADVEIIEWHHRHKQDAPSGTALHFGQLVADVMGQSDHVHGRQGQPGARPHGQIGYHAIRAGDNPGEHTIVFGLPGETIELHVAATSRDCYAYGALAAAKFLVGKAPGLYGMNDVLGL